jgi:hypothetical protein
MHWDGNDWVADTPPAARPASRVKRLAAAALEASLIAALTFGLIAGTAFAAKGSHGGGGGKGGGGSCTPAAPRVHVENTWAWGAWGSFGMAGQELQFQVSVSNYDVGCGSSTFVVSVSAPDGFSVSLPTNTVSLGSSKTAYLSAWVTSSAGAGDGDYPIVATATRSGTSATSGTFTSYYRVYSSDSAGPTLYFPSPGDGAVLASGSTNIGVSARDDHAVKTVKIYVDGDLKASVACDDISYSCTLTYGWSATSGQHTATYQSSDWMGNVSDLTATFTVN